MPRHAYQAIRDIALLGGRPSRAHGPPAACERPAGMYGSCPTDAGRTVPGGTTATPHPATDGGALMSLLGSGAGRAIRTRLIRGRRLSIVPLAAPDSASRVDAEVINDSLHTLVQLETDARRQAPGQFCLGCGPAATVCPWWRGEPTDVWLCGDHDGHHSRHPAQSRHRQPPH